MNNKQKIILGIGIIFIGIIGFLLAMPIISLISLPSGTSLILYSVL